MFAAHLEYLQLSPRLRNKELRTLSDDAELRTYKFAVDYQLPAIMEYIAERQGEAVLCGPALEHVMTSNRPRAVAHQLSTISECIEDDEALTRNVYEKGRKASTATQDTSSGDEFSLCDTVAALAEN
ncbi:hypothetical protein HPB50_025901 [Hyalomma asiaticum]|uniref:Uncharacterized protein n=1 Tax=Hyalomma asiaticum TaxID=266040 RepID=A0ACB7RQD3_HYAAI|nr:hypothetical protein HPB50_025901 [Hyalomma asiaticum]